MQNSELPLIRTLLALALMSTAAQACEGQDACQLGDRSYHLLAPQDWDGTTPLPVQLHFHGWGRQGTLIVKHSRIAGAASPRGVLLLAPNGLGKTWDFWGPGSRDTDFAAAVIEDAAKRYPIDRENIFVSGYSYAATRPTRWHFGVTTWAAVTSARRRNIPPPRRTTSTVPCGPATAARWCWMSTRAGTSSRVAGSQNNSTSCL